MTGFLQLLASLSGLLALSAAYLCGWAWGETWCAAVGRFVRVSVAREAGAQRAAAALEAQHAALVAAERAACMGRHPSMRA